MITRGIHRYCLQATCLLRTFSITIREHLLLHFGMATKPCHRSRASRGVVIILGPALLRAWDMAWKPPPITSASNSGFPGRNISVTLYFSKHSKNKSDTHHKRGKGRINIFLALIYPLVEHDDHKQFNE